jgi:hypothetical protein
MVKSVILNEIIWLLIPYTGINHFSLTLFVIIDILLTI